MKIVLIVGLALVAVVGIVAIIGLILPRAHRASSGITVQHAPDAVWALVRDPGALMGTWKGLQSTRRLPDAGGKEVWEQHASGFSIRLFVDEAMPPSRMVTRIDAAPDAPFGGRWIYQLTRVGAGTQVTVTEEGYVSNPIFRAMMYLMGTHRTADRYLRALGAKLGETVIPVHLD